MEAIPIAAQLTGNALEAELAKLPEPIQQLRRTEDQLRSMLQSAATSYANVERLAAPDAGIGETKGAIPVGRWSTLEPGVFVRFVPNGYTRMTVQVYIPKPLLPAAQPFRARPVTAVPYASPFVLLLGGTVAVPSFSGQRLAASNVPVGNPAPPPSTGQKVAADVKNGHCGGMPLTGLDPALDQSNFREAGGDPTTDPNSTNISLPPNTLALLDGSIMDPGNAPGWATLYHELMHAAIQLYGVGPPPNPAWQDFVREWHQLLQERANGRRRHDVRSVWCVFRNGGVIRWPARRHLRGRYGSAPSLRRTTWVPGLSGGTGSSGEGLRPKHGPRESRNGLR